MTRSPLPRFLLMLAAAACVAASAFLLVPKAYALPVFSTTTVVCNGAACNGTATEKYHYDITPGSGGCTSFDVGFHGNYAITNVVMPTGWSYSIVNPVTWKDMDPFTAHGSVSPGTGVGCDYKMHWSGPSQTSTFVIAYDPPNTPMHPHDAHWVDSTGGRANWANAVGQGTGPIHSPKLSITPP